MHCEDGSDEAPDLCEQCPKAKGWPWRPEEKKMRATLQCQHRYTNKTICATPCDGIDDMCRDYVDEDNCKVPPFSYLVIRVAAVTFTSGMLALAFAYFWSKYIRAAPMASDKAKRKRAHANVEAMGEKELYHVVRKSKKFGAAVQSFILYIWNSKDIVAQMEMAKTLYEMEKEMHSNEHDTNLYIMNKIGTNDSVGRFYDLLDKSISVRIEKWLYRKLPRPVYNLLLNTYIKITIMIISSLFKITLYYTDVCKDSLLAYLIFTQVMGNQVNLEIGGFPTTMFLTLVSSIIATEVLNLLTLILNPEFATWGRSKKVLSVLLSSLLPAYMMLLESWYKVKLILAVKRMPANTSWETHQEGLLARIQSKIYKTRALVVEFRANDNSLEHFLQLFVITLIIFFDRTSSPLFGGFDKVFINEGSDLVFVSALLSVWSLMRGPIMYLSSRKNGFLGIIATLILLPYYAIGAFSRLFMVLLFFAPSMGLFDTMNHYTRGKIEMHPASTDLVIFQPQTSQSYYDLWEESYRFKNERVDDFFTMPTYMFAVIPLALAILHMFASFLFMRPLYKRSGEGFLKQFLQGVQTLVYSPLFCDWEVSYSLSKFKIGIQDAWNQSKKVYAQFQGLFMVENILLLIPMIWLKFDIDRRNAVLEASVFKPVPDEDLSTQRVNILLTLGLVVTFVSPLLQAALAYAYVKFGHSWKRVWRFHILSSPGADKVDDLPLEDLIKEVGESLGARAKFSNIQSEAPKVEQPLMPRQRSQEQHRAKNVNVYEEIEMKELPQHKPDEPQEEQANRDTGNGSASRTNMEESENKEDKTEIQVNIIVHTQPTSGNTDDSELKTSLANDEDMKPEGGDRD